MTLKEMLDEVMLLSGMPTETAYVGNGSDAIERLVSIANREAQRLAMYPWQALRKTYTFTLTTATAYTLPDDFRAFVPDTMYTDSHLEAVDFPTNQGEWAYLQASTGGTGTRVQVRLLGDRLNVYQPTSGEEIRVEYWTKYPVLAADGVTTKQYFTADTDTCVLSDELLIQKVLARHKRLHNLPDWQADQADADREERILKGQDAGSKSIGPCEDSAGDPYYDLWRPVPNV